MSDMEEPKASPWRAQARRVDLHIHTTYSDSALTPQQVVERALELGLKAIAITDHDAVEGIDEASQAAKGRNLEVIPGVELSLTVNHSDLHLLGYFIDHNNQGFVTRLKLFRSVRLDRAKRMVEKLNSLGVNLSLDAVLSIAGSGVVGRPHIAEALVERRYVGSFDEAFARFIGYHAPAYVPKFKLSAEEGIDLIRSVGGIPVLAHPRTVNRDELIPHFIRLGLKGIEIIHPEQGDHLRRYYSNLAKKHGLIVTGGSDCHGHLKGKLMMGTVEVPYSFLEGLKRLKEVLS